MPIFSIIIPCYQQAKYLKECIDSLSAQTFTDFEILLIDDGSPDNTKEVALELSIVETRLQYFYKTNGGLSSARNFGIAHSKGTYLVFLDSDDSLKPDFLAAAYDKLSSDSDIIMTSYSYFNDSKSIHHTVVLDDTTSFKNIIGGNICPPVSIAVKKSFLSITGIFDDSLQANTGTEDWDMWIRFYKAGAKLSTIQQNLANYRVHEHSMSRNGIRMYNALKIVAERAVKIDNRISDQFINNRDYPEIDLSLSIKGKLTLCLGVIVKQGLIKEAEALFNEETLKYNLIWKPKDFLGMYSYLSFRYYFKKDDLAFFIKNLTPHFNAFFTAIGLSPSDKKEAIDLIFQPVRKRMNILKYGIIGKLLNAIPSN